jgi:DNA-binding SARP family transcriptional activator/class 3 adenylate cyclase
MSASMQFLLLGPLEARTTTDAVRLGSIKHRMLLAKLLLRANQVVSTDELIDTVWGENPPPTVRQSLQNHIAALRRAIEPGWPAQAPRTLVTRDPGYMMQLDADLIDLHRFNRLADQGRRTLAEGDPATAVALLREALRLWRGPVLADVVAAIDAPWAELVGIDELRVGALESRIEAELADGRHGQLIGELAALVRLHPLREHLRGQLMLALYRSGRQAEALAAYQAARQTLVEELGIEPSLALQRLEQAILAQDAVLELLAPAPASGAGEGGDGEPEPAAAAKAPPATGAVPTSPERKLVTVLFADVDEPAGEPFERDPEDVSTMLVSCLEQVRQQVEAFGGSVEQSVGGTTMAVFGVPSTGEDDAERAVRAALSIREALHPGRSAGVEGGSGLQVRIALATGEALVRPAPGQGRLAGDLVSTCARLQQAAPSGAVLVTEATGRATERAISYGPPSMLSLHGRSTPMLVWSALETRSHSSIDLSQPPAVPLVGRTSELAVLREAFDQVCSTRVPRLLAVVGDPGIGKTRLVMELARAIEASPELVAWRVGHSLPYGEATSFWALREIVKTEAGILDTDTAERAERKLALAVHNALGEDQGAASWVLGHLRPLVGIGGEAEPPAGRREEALAAWRRFLLGLADGRPLVLLLEDLHWADDGLLDFLESVAEPEPGRTPASLLLLATARPKLLDRRPRWASDGHAVGTVGLGPLSPVETAQLLGALLARHDLQGTVGEALVAAVGGSPLFAEEYVRMLRDRRPGVDDPGMAPAHGVAGLARSLPQLPLPETVHAIIAARLDALPFEEKAVLQDAAVLGRVGWAGALAAVGEYEHAWLDTCLDELTRKEFLRWVRRSSVAGEQEYEFRHVLVRDVAYGQIPRAERAGRHRRAATWLEGIAAGPAEAQGAARTVDRAELLAQHYQQALTFARASGRDDADLRARARVALRNAGDRASALGVHATAASYYCDALELWPADDRERPDLEFRAGKARCYGEGQGEDLLVQAREGLLAAGDRQRAAEAEVLLGQLAFMRGKRERAAHLDHALVLVADAPVSRSRAAVLKNCMLHLMVADQQDEAISVAREALSIAEPLELHEIEAAALEAIGAARVSAGDPDGIWDLERCVAICEQENVPTLSAAYINLASAHATLGDLRRCFGARAAARRAAERFGLTRELRWIQLQQTADRYWSGQWDEALSGTDRTLDDRGDGARHYLESECRIWRGRIQLARGRTAAALEDALRALELARESGDHQNLEPALTFGGRALLASGRVREAAELVDELVQGLGHGLIKPDLGVDLAVSLVGLDYPATVLAGCTPSLWLEAARTFVAGDPGHAARIYAEIGSRPDEAYARLEAGRRRAGTDGQADLDAALAFYREVGASVYVQEAEALCLAST